MMVLPNHPKIDHGIGLQEEYEEIGDVQSDDAQLECRVAALECFMKEAMDGHGQNGRAEADAGCGKLQQHAMLFLFMWLGA